MLDHQQETLDQAETTIKEEFSSLKNAKESIKEELVMLLSDFSNQCTLFSQWGNHEQIPAVLTEVELFKEKLHKLQVRAEQRLRNEIKDPQEQPLAPNDSKHLITAKSEATLQEIMQSVERKQRSTYVHMLWQDYLLAWIDKNLEITNHFSESLKKIQYTDQYAVLWNTKWSLSKTWRVATKEDFENSFEWLFGTRLPESQQNRGGEVEYPRDPRIAIIPILLEREKKWRYGKDQEWHGVGKSGFYDLWSERILKFDDTGGTVRKKRDSDIGLSKAYIQD